MNHTNKIDHDTIFVNKFGQENHTITSLVRSSNNIPVMTSQKDWNEGSGLVGHPKMMSLDTRTSTYMNFRAHTWCTGQSNRQNHLVRFRILQLSVQIVFSHHLHHMIGVVVLETVMSVLYGLTPCDLKTFCFNSCTDYTSDRGLLSPWYC